MTFDNSIGFVSPIVSDKSFLPDGQNDALARYIEVLDLQKATYNEQEYWTKAYQRAQQLGSSEYTVQEIILQLQRISQKLENLDKVLLPPAKEGLSKVASGLKSTISQIQD